jgi:hypothetical protein
MQVDFRPSRFWRVLSGIWLCLAVILIIVGQTIWRDRLSGMGFLIFWSSCFLSAIFAAVCALLDLWTIRRETRIENRRLFQETLKKIQGSTSVSDSESYSDSNAIDSVNDVDPNSSDNQDSATQSSPPLKGQQD